MYEINKETLAILSCGKEKSRIIEKTKDFIINKNATKIIDDSCKYFGSSYLGRAEGSKNILNSSQKLPIIIEESNNIIFFPTTSPRLDKCSWISLNNINKYYKNIDKIVINFISGKNIKLDISYGIIDNQILRATRLEMLFKKRKKNL